MEYQLVAPGEEPSDTQWHEYDPETGITVNEFGTSVLCARSSKSYDAETPDGQYYVATITSETATATYTRTYSAAIDNVTVDGKVGKTLTQDMVIRMNGDRFKNITAGDDVSAWFNLPAGLTAKVKELSNANGYHGTLTVTVSGMPTATSAAAITVTIPKDKLYANNTTDLTVLSNPNAYYSIALDADHQHDYTGQPYLYLDPGNHYQECKAGDGYNIQAHEFTAWTDNGNGTHSRHCTVCKMTDGSTYTETAEHTYGTDWKYDDTNHWHECECGDKADIAAHSASEWIIDTAATETAEGAKHKECTVCKKVLETATIPATGSSHTHSYGVYVGMTYTAGNFIYQITSIDTATLGQSKVIGVVAAKKNKIKKVTIPDRADCKGYRLNVTTIGNNAFAGCKALEKLTIGNKVTVIGKNAFKKCSKLKTVVIGKAVKTISSKAFIGDNKIKKITFKGKKLKTVKKNAFSKKAKKNIKSKKTKLKGNKKAIKLFKKKLKIK